MNVERTIKLLLLKLNKQGKDVSLIKSLKYSETYDTITTYYKLTFWQKAFKRQRNGTLKEVNVPDTHEFTSGVELLKFMVVKSNE